MKKLLTLLFAVAMVLPVFSGCNSKPKVELPENNGPQAREGEMDAESQAAEAPKLTEEDED